MLSLRLARAVDVSVATVFPSCINGVNGKARNLTAASTRPSWPDRAYNAVATDLGLVMLSLASTNMLHIQYGNNTRIL